MRFPNNTVLYFLIKKIQLKGKTNRVTVTLLCKECGRRMTAKEKKTKSVWDLPILLLFFRPTNKRERMTLRQFFFGFQTMIKEEV